MRIAGLYHGCRCGGVNGRLVSALAADAHGVVPGFDFQFSNAGFYKFIEFFDAAGVDGVLLWLVERLLLRVIDCWVIFLSLGAVIILVR